MIPSVIYSNNTEKDTKKEKNCPKFIQPRNNHIIIISQCTFITDWWIGRNNFESIMIM